MSEPSLKVTAIIQARMTSSRLPGKIMKPLAGEPLIRRMVERVLRIEGLDSVAIALAEGAEHQPTREALDGLDVLVVEGPEDDVLARTALAARESGAGIVMRITSDCPLVDPAVSATVLAAYHAARPAGAVYARTAFDTGYPLGFDTEVFDAALLFEADHAAQDPYEREHVTPYIWRRPEKFPFVIVDDASDRRHWRLVVDTEEDYELVARVYDRLYAENPAFGYTDICQLFDREPGLLEINAGIEQTPYVRID
jgi:spore coat polysaccharide biosynthesis protein SpsF